MDWSLLQKNKHLFSAIREQLESQERLLVVQTKSESLLTNGHFNISCGYFGIFAPRNRNVMYVKAIVPKELLLPEHPLADYEIPANTPLSMKDDARKCIEELTLYDECNPVYFSSGLGEQLTKTLNKIANRGRNRTFFNSSYRSNKGYAYPKNFESHAPPLGSIKRPLGHKIPMQHDERVPKDAKLEKAPKKKEPKKMIEALESVKEIFD